MANPATHMTHALQGPLAQLRDIHTPAPVSNWPPAPGWFILAALLLIAVVALTWWLFRRWWDNRYRREAMRELESLRAGFGAGSDPAGFLTDYSALLKRAALSHYPRGAVAHLTGEAWVEFLDKSAGTNEFSMGAGQVLIDGNYRPIDEAIDIDELHRLGRYWIRRHSRKTLEKAA